MSEVIVSRPSGSWTIAFCEAKLVVRGRLPGASSYDLSALTFQVAQEAGLLAVGLLPPALPASWLVNNRTTSPTFQRWLSSPLIQRWEALLSLLDGDTNTWLESSLEKRQATLDHAQNLAIDGQGIAALSKVLTLLRPNSSFLMDDAALWFALGAVDQPHDALHPSAGTEHFLPALDWFAEAVGQNLPTLQKLADTHRLLHLTPAQVLDRLLWFESWGHRLFQGEGRWWWVSDNTHEAIVPMQSQHSPAPPGAKVCLDKVEDPAWRKRAQEMLDSVFPSRK